MPLSDLIVVKLGGIEGNCWFAGKDIPCGTPLWWSDGSQESDTKYHVPIKDHDKISADRIYLAYQISNTHYCIIPRKGQDPKYSDDVIEKALLEVYVNHSCNGNAWYLNDLMLVAKRDIKRGEEIAYDYAMTETNPDFKLDCLCRKPECRKSVTGNDYKNPKLQQAYRGHFMSHTQQKINEVGGPGVIKPKAKKSAAPAGKGKAAATKK